MIRMISFARPITHGKWRGAPRASLGLAATLVACSSQTSVERPRTNTERDQDTESRCEELASARPDIVPPEDLKTPTSHLAIRAQLSEGFINDLLDDHLPRRLAEERDRHVGAPGRATYRVERGRLSLVQRKRDVSFELPLSADISVCKPFGKSCFRYGACHPAFTLSLGVAERMDERFDFEVPTLSYRTLEGCRIGIDVTSQIETIVDRELESARKRLRAQWPDLRQYASDLSRHRDDPIPLYSGRCARWDEIELTQQPLQVVSKTKDDGPHLVAAVGLSGKLDATSNCEANRNEGEIDLPKLTTVRDISPTSRIFLPENVSLSTFRRRLQAQLAEQGEVDAKIGELVFGSGEEVHFTLDTRGKYCGSLWLNAQLRMDENYEHVVLENVRVEGASASQSRDLADMLAAIERFKLPTKTGSWLRSGDHLRMLDQSLAPLSTDLSPHGLELASSDLSVEAPRLQTTSKGLHLFYPIVGRIELTSDQGVP